MNWSHGSRLVNGSMFPLCSRSPCLLTLKDTAVSRVFPHFHTIQSDPVRSIYSLPGFPTLISPFAGICSVMKVICTRLVASNVLLSFCSLTTNHTAYFKGRMTCFTISHILKYVYRYRLCSLCPPQVSLLYLKVLWVIFAARGRSIKTITKYLIGWCLKERGNGRSVGVTAARRWYKSVWRDSGSNTLHGRLNVLEFYWCYATPLLFILFHLIRVKILQVT